MGWSGDDLPRSVDGDKIVPISRARRVVQQPSRDDQIHALVRGFLQIAPALRSNDPVKRVHAQLMYDTLCTKARRLGVGGSGPDAA